MPLPLPNLDTRRWGDLVDEARALIPRYAPQWTDHNVHDPGVTLLELFAWVTETLMYRANRIPERHRRKFVALTGHLPTPPLPAATALGLSLVGGTGTLAVPAGTFFVTGGGAPGALPFRATAPVTVVEASLVALQQFDGARFLDRSRALAERLPIPLLGADPRVPDPYDAERAPALYLGFDRAFPAGVTVSVHLYVAGTLPGERDRLVAEKERRQSECASVRPPVACTPCAPIADPWCAATEDTPTAPTPGAPAGAPPPAASTLPPHHSARVTWEYLAADGWHAFDAGAGEVADDTRALTLDGRVLLRVPGTIVAKAVGAVATPRHWVRCRLAAGQFDAAPVLSAAVMNAVPVEQSIPVRQTFAIAPLATIDGAIVPGARLRIAMELDADGAVTRLGVASAGSLAPEVLVVALERNSASIPVAVALTLARPAAGTGLPEQHASLAGAPVARGAAEVWSVEGGAWRPWSPRLDLDASGPTDAHHTLDATSGELRFGTGARGRVPPAGAWVLAEYMTTAAEQGTVAAGRAWAVADDALNAALLASPAAFAAAIAAITNPVAAAGGAAAETLDHAVGRAAAALWAHERLVEICPAGECPTLDQLDRDAVLDLPAPERAATLLDVERIALDVPGTRVRRARAWADLDPAYPCLRAPGTVALVILPELPLGRPRPSRGLVQAVRRHLDLRRVLCTRIVVAGPEYLEVSVRASVRARRGADGARVRDAILAALTTFLDPLRGGPAGRGWPFGRDVYRSEILALIDGVSGVDHVLSLELSTPDGAGGCGNLCLAPTWLAASGTHSIEVVGA